MSNNNNSGDNKIQQNSLQNQSNLQQVNIQKGKDPLGSFRTKPNVSDQFVVNKNNNDSNLAGDRSTNMKRIISFNTGRPTVGGPDNNIINLNQNNTQYQIQSNNNNNNNNNSMRKESPNNNIHQDNRDSTSPNKQKLADKSTAIFSNYQASNPFGQFDAKDDFPRNNRQSLMNNPNNNLNNNNNNQHQIHRDNSNNNSYNQIPSSDQLEIKNNPLSTVSDKNQVKVINMKGKDPSQLLQEQENMYNTLKSIKVERDFILKGEELKAYSETSLKCGQYSVEGKLVLTNYKIVFVPNDEQRLFQFIDRKEYQLIPLGFIHKLERSQEKKGLQYSYIDIICKDGRNYRFRYSPECANQSFEMQTKIHQFAFPEDVRRLFSYSSNFFDRSLEEQYQGWNLYDIKAEFDRQGLTIQPPDYNDRNPYDKDYGQSPFKYLDNSNGNICSTYPPLIVLPSKMSNDEIIKCSKFRSRERLPALTFAFKKRQNSNYTTLWRCAQCKPGINSNRSVDDETMLRVIGCLENNSNTVKTVKIYDARPYLNAVGQQITGKGYEQKQFYRNCEIEFLDIHNIHKVRESYRKMAASAYASSTDYLKEMEKSDWFVHIGTIIEGTRRVLFSLLSEVNVVIHCSDGWDRTSQLICLAQICIDPYYRTLEGFEVLIEKDWVSFGHQFSIRGGHASKNFNDDQRAPIFIQFLDCVYQLLEQYPLSFEFNSKFLAEIAHHYLSCRFGTFLFNSYQDQLINNARHQTISLWSYLNSQRVTFENPFYLSVHDTNLSILRPDSHIRRFTVWKEHFMIFQKGYCDVYKIYNECNFPEDNRFILKRSSQMRYEQFREENKLLHKKIEELEAQLKTQNNNNNNQVQTMTQNEINRRISNIKLSQNPLMQATFEQTKKTTETSTNKDYEIHVIDCDKKQDNQAVNNNDNAKNANNNNHNQNQQHLNQVNENQEECSNQELDRACIMDAGEEKAEDFGSMNQDDIERESNLQSNSKMGGDFTEKFDDSTEKQNEEDFNNILNDVNDQPIQFDDELDSSLNNNNNNNNNQQIDNNNNQQELELEDQQLKDNQEGQQQDKQEGQEQQQELKNEEQQIDLQ